MQYLSSYVISVSPLPRLDEAAVSLQKEKNMYKEIENYPTCFKVYFTFWEKGTEIMRSTKPLSPYYKQLGVFLAKLI